MGADEEHLSKHVNRQIVREREGLDIPRMIYKSSLTLVLLPDDPTARTALGLIGQ